MIEGDIDLTENLDFYREKKTLEDKVYLQGSRGYSKPKIPWKKRQNKLPSKYLNDPQVPLDYKLCYQPTSTSSYVSWHWTPEEGTYIIDIPVANMAISVNNDEEFGSYQVSNIVANGNNSWTLHYDSTLPMYNMTDWTCCWTNYSTNDSTSNDTTVYTYREEEKEIFPSRKKFAKIIKTLVDKGIVERCRECGRYFFKYKIFQTNACPDCKKKDYFEDSPTMNAIKKIRHSGKRKDFIEAMCYNHDLAWGIEGYDADDCVYEFDAWHWMFGDKMIRSDILHHIGHDKREFSGENRNIPWLKDMSHRSYYDYMKSLYEEEEDYMKYLTNMGWIGVHKTEHVYEDNDIDSEDMVLNWNVGINNFESEEAVVG